MCSTLELLDRRICIRLMIMFLITVPLFGKVQ